VCLLALAAIYCGLALLAGGCAAPARTTASTDHRHLAADLVALDPKVDHAEAELTARTACEYPLALAREYRLVRPPLFHNLLVNVGLRKRGLCYHWADDLAAKLGNLPGDTLMLHRAVAHRGSMREHNSIVITAAGQPFEQGLVLDAWRHSGLLYWGPVKADKYPWIEIIVPAPQSAEGPDPLRTAAFAR
jgi:hypothetical protein